MRGRWPIMAWVMAGLALATLLAFAGVRDNGFIGYDDPHYLTDNARVQQGLTADNVAWAFTTGYFANWHPLTWLSHMLDCQLFGMDPAAHHGVSLLFHLVATLLLFGVLRGMTGDIWPAAIVAALFAVHPTRVESVAWASERKDVLSAVFWFATMAAYLLYVRRPSGTRLVAVAILLALGLMAKPMLVTLPFVLLLLDYWPLRRIDGLSTAPESDQTLPAVPTITVRKALVEKIPLLALAVVSSIVTYRAQEAAGAVDALGPLPLSTRLANIPTAYVGYLVDLVWPTDLAIFYPYDLGRPPWQVAGSIGLLLAITIGCLIRWRKQPYLIVGWGWFLGTLVPVIGLVQVGAQARADRYTYLPFVGLFIAIVWTVCRLIQSRRSNPRSFAILAALLIAACVLLTRRQVGYWRDTMTVFQHALDVTEDNYVAHGYVGSEHARAGNVEKAMEHYHRSLQIRPNHYYAHYNLANLLLRLGDVDGAVAHYDAALGVNPTMVQAHQNRGVALVRAGRLAEAEASFREGLAIDPDSFDCRLSLAHVLRDQEKIPEAVEQYQRALALNPTSQSAQNGLQRSLAAAQQEQRQTR